MIVKKQLCNKKRIYKLTHNIVKYTNLNYGKR